MWAAELANFVLLLTKSQLRFPFLQTASNLHGETSPLLLINTGSRKQSPVVQSILQNFLLFFCDILLQHLQENIIKQRALGRQFHTEQLQKFQGKKNTKIKQKMKTENTGFGSLHFIILQVSNKYPPDPLTGCWVKGGTTKLNGVLGAGAHLPTSGQEWLHLEIIPFLPWLTRQEGREGAELFTEAPSAWDLYQPTREVQDWSFLPPCLAEQGTGSR